jgi:hypothetical protein
MVERPALGGMRLAGALGLNLWALALVVPLAFARAGQVAWLAAVAPVVLLVGVQRRSAPALLLGVPVATLAPLALGDLEAARQNVGGFALVAAALVAYELAALSALAPDLSPAAARPLLPEPVSRRWRRRLRVYRGLAVAMALGPALLLFAALRPQTAAAVAASFGGAAERGTTLLLAVVGLATSLWFALSLAPALAGHLDRDAAVRARLERDREAARRGRPGLVFYVAVALAVALITLALVLGS